MLLLRCAAASTRGCDNAAMINTAGRVFVCSRLFGLGQLQRSRVDVLASHAGALRNQPAGRRGRFARRQRRAQLHLHRRVRVCSLQLVAVVAAGAAGIALDQQRHLAARAPTAQRIMARELAIGMMGGRNGIGKRLAMLLLERAFERTRQLLLRAMSAMPPGAFW